MAAGIGKATTAAGAVEAATAVALAGTNLCATATAILGSPAAGPPGLELREGVGEVWRTRGRKE